ncbi:MAG: MotE family protein [Hyphomicrobium zavarzinii]|uniref:MotE family protein n=1 Tax=Hyphomicrobium zavarzinii TaxID=48292 RepID=UPI001A586A13|nr:MotE family protein [Hyphomicrobium zavarzinii]MBL8847767.1 MotE family protein [Hyphomicrobium zavarzinii]
MRRQQAHGGRFDRIEVQALPRGLEIAFWLAALLLVAALWSPASAQQGWMPTVATTPGGTFNAPPPGSANRPAATIDPRFFPAQRNTPPNVRNPLPQGAWSPIVTGAIPQRRATTPAAGARSVPDATVPPLAGPTPIRPLTAQPVAPAQAVAAAAENAAAAKAPEAAAGESAPATDNGTLFKKPGPLDALPPNATAAQQYCFNTADTAADARFAWQAKKIKEMEAELDKRAQLLESKTLEYKRWLERRDEFSRKAHEKLVGFYSRMRPDAAAVQLATLDEEMAAAVVTKLETKVASQIMGEMDPERAAKIATIISGAAKVPPERRRAAGQAGGAAPEPPAGEAPQPQRPGT